MPGHVRNKNLQYDDDDFYDDDYYDDYHGADDGDYYDEPVAQPKVVAQPKPKQPVKPAKGNTNKDHFEGIVWGRIPSQRMSRIVEDRQQPRGRLLGGSGKPSKLQALAAQRRKQQEEKKSQDDNKNRDRQPSRNAGTSSVSILDKLQKRDAADTQDPLGAESKEQSSSSAATPRFKREKIISVPPAGDDVEHTEVQIEASSSEERSEQHTHRVQYDLRAEPSVFASALLSRNGPGRWSGDTNGYRLVAAASANTDPFVGPSPDDVVSKAQTKSSKQPPKKAPTDKATANGVAQGVAGMKITEPPTIKSKNLDVPAKYEKSGHKGSANFVVIGHVDHGKSTLMGRLLLDLKHPTLSQRDFEKLQKASNAAGKGSFALAWAMDARADEREHGVTIDIATQYFSTEKTDFTILDAPGHQDFVKNMIAGTSQADFAVLVVDASTDAFEAGLRGQTREHAMLARSMGIARLVVAINKMDSAKWNKERFEEVVGQLQGFFSAAGFNQSNIVFVPCAGLTGENVVKHLTGEQKKLASWYSGPSLVQALEESEPRQRRLKDPLRVAVSDVFANTVSGAPTGNVSVTGLIDAGNLQVGTKILAQPSGEAGAIKGIEVGGTPRDWAVAGQITTLHLVGVQEEHLKVGDVLCERGNKEIQNVKTFTAKCLAFEHLLPTQLALHRGQIYCTVKIQFLELLDNKAASGSTDTKKNKRPPRAVHPQQAFRVMAELYDEERGLPLDLNDRVVFRENGKTVATGVIDGIEEYVKR